MVAKAELKLIKSLKSKKYRTREGKFTVEGLKNVKELLNSNFEVEMVVCSEEYSNHFTNFPHFVISKSQLNSISSFVNNETCLAVAKLRSFDEVNINYSDHLIVLDGVRDPGNLGTIIRSLDWFGFDQVICSPDCADFYNPKTITASMGSFARITPYYTSLEAFVSNYHGRSYSLTLDGDPIEQSQLGKPSLFVLGSESHGISDKLLSLIPDQLTISRYGKAESMNVAMVSSILMYHLRS